MIELTDEMRDAIDNNRAQGAPVMLATAGKSGMPDVVYKGSTMVWDNEHLAYWERARGQTLRNLEENPQICLFYRNPQTRLAWKFFGVAELLYEGDLRQRVMDRTIEAELAMDPERKGVAVIVRVDRVLQAGRVLMQREE
jgi:predicted pyridoxine 5'-phosphate oxidase superfamily flavin-nucleotide-binding protein